MLPQIRLVRFIHIAKNALDFVVALFVMVNYVFLVPKVLGTEEVCNAKDTNSQRTPAKIHEYIRKVPQKVTVPFVNTLIVLTKIDGQSKQNIFFKSKVKKHRLLNK